MSDHDDNGKTWRTWVADLFSGEPTDRRELLGMLKDANERQLLDLEALNIIHGAIGVADMRARDIMIPRSQLVTVSIDSRVEDFLPTIVDSTHSRFPVTGEDMDDMRGILHAKDMLPLALSRDTDEFDIKDHIRPVTMVPESKRLNVLLQDFRATRNHMAVVIDEYGNVAGAVTIEDVLEQIVGDIEDEHDTDDDSSIRPQGEGCYTVKATTPIEDFNEYFASAFDDDEFDTIGGLVLRKFGHLPTREEAVTFDGFEFRVLNADSRRINLLQLTREA